VEKVAHEETFKLTLAVELAEQLLIKHTIVSFTVEVKMEVTDAVVTLTPFQK
jgi:hypothetical protein